VGKQNLSGQAMTEIQMFKMPSPTYTSSSQREGEEIGRTSLIPSPPFGRGRI